jgi:GTPase SAR1 family protein
MSLDHKSHLHEKDSLEALIYGIHRSPGLRDWVTLETEALPPVPQVRSGRWTLVSLLALPYREKGSTLTSGYLPPWGLVAWSWPERRVIQMQDIRNENPVNGPPEPLPLLPADYGHVPNLEEQIARAKRLFHSLEKLLQQPASADLDLRLLGELYVGLLPPALYQWYWRYVPSSKSWLQVPDVSKRASAVPPTETTKDAKYDEQPSEDEEPPTDLTVSNKGWFKQAFTLAESYQIEEVTKRLQALQRRSGQPSFRVAFVGEFSRGKSTLINRLLERDLLPTGALSTTNTITSIVYGESEGMEVRLTSGKLEHRPLTELSWSDLVVPLKGGAEQSHFAQVRITLNHPWLRQLNAEIIDTPGFNDINGARSALASDVLYNSDAAIFVTSAQAAIGLTEALFLQEEVIGYHVSRIAVVVTMLDMIAVKDRLPVMESVHEKISKIAPRVPILASYPLSDNDSEIQVLAVVRTHIAHLAGRVHRRAWRSRQIAGMIATYAQQLAKLGQVALENAQQEHEQQLVAQRNLQNEMRHAMNEWDIIGNELSTREHALANEMRRRLDTFKKRFLEVACFELSKTPDPKIWWERDFPFRIRQELTAQAQGAEAFVRGAIERDLHWLYTRVQETFKISLEELHPHADPTAEPGVLQSQVALTDFQRIRLFSRIGTGVATVATAFLLGPVSIGVSIGAGIVSEYQLTKRIHEQQQTLESEVAICIERSCEAYICELSKRLHAFYTQAIDEIQQQQGTWETSRMRLLKERIPVSQVPRWQQLITSANALQQEIQAALQL